MKRLLIFMALFPPLVAVAFIVLDASDVPTRGHVGEMLLFFLFVSGFAYLWAVVPSWVLAGVDWALSEKPLYLRLAATMILAGIIAVLFARALGQTYEVLKFAAIGAIPAAICSWLSEKFK